MTTTALECRECGYRSLQWVGRCPGCGAWDALSASLPVKDRGLGEVPAPVELAGISATSRGGIARLPTGIDELDRVLGGGLVPGATALLAGEPGVGKSTLTLQAAAGLAGGGWRVLVICGEESLEQVAARAARLRRATAGITVSDSTDPRVIASQMNAADVVIVDSIQSLRGEDLAGEAGSVSQVRGAASLLAEAARRAKVALLLVGHVTKDGSVAGPRALEHLVDAVLTFEGDRGHTLRTVRGIKNRYGPTSEVGLFEMDHEGLKQVADASRLLLGAVHSREAGSAVGCVIEGRRPLAIEVQTLVAQSSGSMARRIAQGFDSSRLGVGIAILSERCDLALGAHDVYASIAGGFRVSDPGIDLALMLALASAKRAKPIASATAAVGEVGLGGEIRSVPGLRTRMKELARLGFTSVIAPLDAMSMKGVEVHAVSHLRAAIALVL